jgi:hypothetical protein
MSLFNRVWRLFMRDKYYNTMIDCGLYSGQQLYCVASSCPSVCSCTDTSHGVVLHCNNRGLYSIPADLPNNTYDL